MRLDSSRLQAIGNTSVCVCFAGRLVWTALPQLLHTLFILSYTANVLALSVRTWWRCLVPPSQDSTLQALLLLRMQFLRRTAAHCNVLPCIILMLCTGCSSSVRRLYAQLHAVCLEGKPIKQLLLISGLIKVVCDPGKLPA